MMISLQLNTLSPRMGPVVSSASWRPASSQWVPTFARPPQPVHPMPQQHGPGQLRKGLGDVEVTQGADLEEGHAQTLREGLRLLRGDLPLEGQVQAVPHQDLRDSGGVLEGGGKAGKTYSFKLVLLARVCAGVNGVPPNSH